MPGWVKVVGDLVEPALDCDIGIGFLGSLTRALSRIQCRTPTHRLPLHPSTRTLSRAVFATVRKEADAAGLTAPKGAEGRIVPLICDICDVDSLVEARAIVERECEAGGKDLQGIVNNAGEWWQCCGFFFFWGGGGGSWTNRASRTFWFKFL